MLSVSEEFRCQTKWATQMIQFYIILEKKSSNFVFDNICFCIIKYILENMISN